MKGIIIMMNIETRPKYFFFFGFFLLLLLLCMHELCIANKKTSNL